MIENLFNELGSISYGQLLTWLFGLSVIFFVGSMVGIWVVLIRLPEDYLIRDGVPNSKETSRSLVQLLRKIVLNMVGIGFLFIGLVMLLTPGQGILSILVGITLMDFPGKHRLILRILSHPKVFHAINTLRSKSDKPPLLTDIHPNSAGGSRQR